MNSNRDVDSNSYSTGGNVQDLITRVFCAVLGSLWAGLSYAAGDGNPYVIAVFAVIFMLPMMYRYTQSTHPVSFITCYVESEAYLIRYRDRGS